MDPESEAEKIERELLRAREYFDALKINPKNLVLGFECGMCGGVTPISLNEWNQPMCAGCGTLCSDKVRDLLEHTERVTKIPLERWPKHDS